MQLRRLSLIAGRILHYMCDRLYFQLPCLFSRSLRCPLLPSSSSNRLPLPFSSVAHSRSPKPFFCTTSIKKCLIPLTHASELGMAHQKILMFSFLLSVIFSNCFLTFAHLPSLHISCLLMCLIGARPVHITIDRGQELCVKKTPVNLAQMQQEKESLLSKWWMRLSRIVLTES